ncbi:callose synthase 10-like isoform X4 [Humulus lupulus]|uniref:callose synthase 10-like isoform X4 n=1 Tax=Humulus lupulus TaxID=3486 RepID=UPI002B40D8BF|nr:callose synthase 10-like isoform X4 [Humulus lupulus]
MSPLSSSLTSMGDHDYTHGGMRWLTTMMCSGFHGSRRRLTDGASSVVSALPTVLENPSPPKSSFNEQKLAKKEGAVIDRSQDIALLQDFYKLYREQNDVEKLREEELNLRETGAFSGDLGDKKKIEERKCWLRRFEPGTHLDQKNSKQAFPFWFAFVSLPKGEDTDVKRDDLARALMVAFSSTPLLEPYVIPLLLEKLSSSLPSSKLGGGYLFGLPLGFVADWCNNWCYSCIYSW